MKLNAESKKIIDILNTYLEELNEVLLDDKDTLELLYEKRNLQEEAKKKNAANNIRYNAFAPRINEVAESTSEEKELLEQIHSYEEKVNIQKSKVDSIQNSINDFLDSMDKIKEESINENKDESKNDDSVSTKDEVNKDIKEDIKEEIKVVEIIKEIPRETLENKILKNELNSISKNIGDITYTSIYDYRNVNSEIKKIKKHLDDIIDKI